MRPDRRINRYFPRKNGEIPWLFRLWLFFDIVVSIYHDYSIENHVNIAKKSKFHWKYSLDYQSNERICCYIAQIYR
nr:MAG TPA: hypothetical protein [Caudoviricetes sp.]